MKKIDNPINLRTGISAEFVTMLPPDPEGQVFLDALNKHAEDICESLQPIFQNLVIQMLALKREKFTTGG